MACLLHILYIPHINLQLPLRYSRNGSWSWNSRSLLIGSTKFSVLNRFMIVKPWWGDADLPRDTNPFRNDIITQIYSPMIPTEWLLPGINKQCAFNLSLLLLSHREIFRDDIKTERSCPGEVTFEYRIILIVTLLSCGFIIRSRLCLASLQTRVCAHGLLIYNINNPLFY